MSEEIVINRVLLHFGYVENSKLAGVICTNERHVFGSEDAAIKDLAQDLLAKYKERFEKRARHSRTCCHNAAKQESNNYCNKCGTQLKYKFDVLAFKDWLYELSSYDLDSFGYDEEADGRELSWLIGDSLGELLTTPRTQVAIVTESAEKVLLEVLGLEDE